MPLPLIYILDANLLLRLADQSNPMHQTATNAVTALLASNALLRTVPQSFFEFWSVATRPAEKNGLGLSIADAIRVLHAFGQSFPTLPDDPTILGYWQRLLVTYSVGGKQGHDARYIAAMQAQGLTHFLTFDSDFNRYAAEGITIVHPANVPVATD
jgi:predicted nucleic acid-binding protein